MSTEHNHKQTTAQLIWSQAAYRWLAGILVLVALLLATLTPHDQRRLRMPDPWAYEIATQQFAQGQWILDDDQAAQVRTDVRLRGGSLDQYVPTSDDNQWAFRQSPGYPLLLVPFFKLGIPRAANLLLAVVAAIILYGLLARRYDESIAFVGVVLLVWSPLSLLALHYLYMDTYASGILLVISGGILLWVGGWKKPIQKTKTRRRRKKQKRASSVPKELVASIELKRNVFKKQHITWFLLFASGLTAGWAVVVRNVNALPAVVLGGYFLYIWRQQQQAKQWNWSHLLLFALGGIIAIAGLLAYNAVVFGSPIDTGYAYPSPDDPLYLWKGNPVSQVPGGTQTWLAEGSLSAIVRTLFDHIRLWVRPATLGWPFLPFMFISIVWQTWRKEVGQTTVFLLLWILAVYAFYAGIVFFGITRALSVPFNQTWGFFTPVRYLFPATLPFILLTVDWLARWPRRWALSFAFFYITLGGWIFWQVLKWT